MIGRMGMPRGEEREKRKRTIDAVCGVLVDS